MLPDYLTSALTLFAREHAVFFASASVLLCASTVVLGAQSLRARWTALRTVKSPDLLTQRQLADLARAVDAVAIEVERIGEAQRFSSQRIEGTMQTPERRPYRTPTPH